MAFAQNLHYLLNSRSMSKYRLAQLTGVSQTTVANWVSGKTVPYPKDRDAIAKVFGVSVESLMSGDIQTAQETKKESAVSDELLESLEILRERPETRTLLHASKGMTAEQVQKMAEFMMFVKGATNVKTD